jgi:hypothetical protein
MEDLKERKRRTAFVFFTDFLSKTTGLAWGQIGGGVSATSPILFSSIFFILIFILYQGCQTVLIKYGTGLQKYGIYNIDIFCN